MAEITTFARLAALSIVACGFAVALGQADDAQSADIYRR